MRYPRARPQLLRALGYRTGSQGRTRTCDMLVTLSPSLSGRSVLYHDPPLKHWRTQGASTFFTRVLPFGIVSEPSRQNSAGSAADYRDLSVLGFPQFTLFFNRT